MLTQLPHPIIFAHRGASAHAPENTLAAFELALHQGADAIELDAKLCKDGQVVVIHDPTVNRTTQGQGLVKELSLAELRELDAGSSFDIAFRGERIPTLDEVFMAVGKLAYINVELTNYGSATDDLPAKVAAIVRTHKLSRSVLFSSFNPFQLMRIHRLIPEAPLGLLAHRGSKGMVARSPISQLFSAKFVHPHKMDVSQTLIEQVHNRGQRVYTYTVNQESEMREYFQMGVDGIFTDDPLLALEVLGKDSRVESTL